jgi:NAD(P)-dependent dehydrogenase (short-subunit alcohol dehydrogenase family)
VLITGANKGIGLELARQYQARGDEVVAVCRAGSADIEGLGVTVIEGIDVTVGDDIAKLAAMVSGMSFDILLHNAGILRRDTLDTLDFDDMLEQYQVNAIGPLRVVSGLLDNLPEGARVGIVSSRVGSIADNQSGNNYGYRASKTAANMIGMNLSHDLRPRGVAVALLHPGLVATQMTGGRGIPAIEAATGLIARMDALTLSSSGGFWHANGERLPW